MRLTTIGLRAVLPFVAAACGSDHNLTAPLDPSAVTTISTTAACGATILEDLRLEEDLTCSGDGLFVGADGITINLNGHVITGAGTAVGIGITVRGRQNVTIYGGTIQGFITGIMVATSTGVVIKDNGFTQTREAVFLAGSSGNVIKNIAA